MFEGFELSMVDTGDAAIRVRRGGSGPPVLLLHGHPQTHVMWHKVAPLLARDFTVVAADLRGYGQSSKPATTPDHMPYSKRVMALDQIAVMQHFGFEKFSVVGHDRGGRCAYRMALDYPEGVEKLAVLDIIPTGEALRRTNMEFAMGFWHWFFLAQPYDLPERMINANRKIITFAKDGTALTRRRWQTICRPSITRTPSTRCARTTAPVRRSTSSLTRRIAAGNGLPVRHWLYGVCRGSWKNGMTFWMFGISGLKMFRGMASTAVTTWQRKRRRRRILRCMTS